MSFPTGDYCPYRSSGLHEKPDECGDCSAALSEIRDEIVRLSGSGKQIAPDRRRHGIYSSMTLDGLSDMLAVRDTLVRFTDFGIPDDLSGKRVLDVGSNVGAVSFEAARRGAQVVGIEFRRDRVDLCGRVARHYGLDAAFYCGDLRDLREEDVPLDVWRAEYDLVLCCSVDEYIPDRLDLYRTLYCHARETLYLESNVQRGQSEMETVAMLLRAGFSDATYVGNGHSGGIARRRKLFRATV